MVDRIDTDRLKNPLPPHHQEKAVPGKNDGKEAGKAADSVSIGGQKVVDKTYGPGLKVGSNYELLRNLVIKTFQDQGIALQVGEPGQEVDLHTMTPEEARELVSEDGYFGVEQTSDRIVDFALNAFGRDPQRLQEMKDAIDRGFRDAQDAFGGALPEISQQTYEAVMNKLDAFADQAEAPEE